jgi:antiviral helicase SKI2
MFPLQRGHVWEEVLILLPPHVIIVMLSATVPNTLEFADWVGRTKKKQVFVISTPKRTVPLEHSLYLGFNQNVNTRMHLVLDSSNNFISEGYAIIFRIYYVLINVLKIKTESRLLMSLK